MIGVIDYGAGNIGSLMNALRRLETQALLLKDPAQMQHCEKIIFPGDGHFASAADALSQSGYDQSIREWIQKDKPFLGICIGLQLLFDSSEEAPGAAGLGIIHGTVRRFPGRKVPQIGWNQTYASTSSKLLEGLPPNSFFYYIHSYYVLPTEESVIAAYAEYGLQYCSAIEQGALAAVQFHPEKSGTVGLALLKNWLNR
ncbi:MAG: imidazole glycerol phosphate synthase subunit HisH [Spirochaetaceae bacterium]|jgi:imidazole glycerol phosphate synthase glutamine amidotransferase subunit|nr:imidazole glycerol phosphate synthase subunit HisH [Spirochaetaceae bacterium]